MNPLSLNKNKATIFILPIIFKGKKSTELITEEFINAYIADFNRAEFDDDLLVVFTNKIETNIQPKEVYKNGDHTVHAYSIPDEYLSDYFKIIAGQYSSTSDSCKELILSFWEIGEKSSLYEILYGLKKDDLEKGYDERRIKELLPEFKLSDEVYEMGILE